MEVYVDVVVLENFIINFFLLLITMNIVKIRGDNKRLILSSIIGAVYTLLMFVPEAAILVSLPIKLIVAFIMVGIVAWKKNFLFYLKSYICFLMLSFVLCGICFGFALFQNPYSFQEGYRIDNYLSKYLLLGIITLYILINRVVFFVKDRISVSKLIYDLEIEYQGRQINVKGFLDTGNSLVEPVTSLPVIILEKKFLNDIKIDKDRCFYIPYKVVDGFNDKLMGFKADKVKISSENGFSYAIKAIICLCDIKLSKDDEFVALLSRGVI